MRIDITEKLYKSIKKLLEEGKSQRAQGIMKASFKRKKGVLLADFLYREQ